MHQLCTKIVHSRLQWFGYVERTGEDYITKASSKEFRDNGLKEIRKDRTERGGEGT